MEIYVCNTGQISMLDFMRRNGIHRMLSSWRNPQEFRYSIDNGAYGCWKRGEPFDAESFKKLLKKVDAHSYRPDFVVCPDIVAGGFDSLKFSLEWADQVPREDYYLAVQDGMDENEVLKITDGFIGIFVGGTMDWKLKTSEQWVKFAHKQGIKCHVGRIGTLKNLLLAKRIGVDSIDSSTFAYPDRLDRFQRIIAMTKQTCIDGPCTGDRVICNGCALPHEGPERGDH